MSPLKIFGGYSCIIFRKYIIFIIIFTILKNQFLKKEKYIF